MSMEIGHRKVLAAVGKMADLVWFYALYYKTPSDMKCFLFVCKAGHYL